MLDPIRFQIEYDGRSVTSIVYWEFQSAVSQSLLDPQKPDPLVPIDAGLGHDTGSKTGTY